MGSLYYYGDGVTQDYEQAFYWCQKAAEQGNAQAQSMTGNAYQLGNGVAQADSSAARTPMAAARIITPRA